MSTVKALPVYSKGTGSTRPTPATVYPKSGNTPYTGYVIGGKTYKDPYGNERIDYGSTVELGDGRTYIYTSETGGVPDSATAMRDYKSNFDAMTESYRRSGKNSDAAIDAAVDKLVNNLRREKQDAHALYNAQVEEARDEYRRASDPYGAVGQRLEALGLGDSGYAETTYARIGNEYQKSIRAAADAYKKTAEKINAQITQAYNDGDIEKAKAWQEIERDILDVTNEFNSKYAAMMQESSKRAEERERWEDERTRQQTEWEYKTARDAKADAEKSKADSFEKALELIKLGISNDEIADALGLTPSQAENIAKGYRKEEKVVYRTSAKSSSSPKSAQTEKKEEEKKEEKKTGKTKGNELTREQIEEHKTQFYKTLRQVLANEGIHTNRDAKRQFESMLERAIETGYIPKSEKAYMEPPKIYTGRIGHFTLEYK